MCKEEITARETICYIPNKLLISTETARNSEIAEIFRVHPDVFLANEDRDFNVLVVFLMYERSKGPESFWHPYFETVQLVDLPALWEDEDIEKLQDPELVENIKYFKERLGLDWESLKSIIQVYTPQYFSEEKQVYDD